MIDKITFLRRKKGIPTEIRKQIIKEIFKLGEDMDVIYRKRTDKSTKK